MDSLDSSAPMKNLDKVKVLVMKHIETCKEGVSVWDLVTNNVCTYEDGCKVLTDLEIDGKIKSDVSTLWVST